MRKSLRMKAIRLREERPFLITLHLLYSMTFPRYLKRNVQQQKIHSILQPEGDTKPKPICVKLVRLRAPKYLNDVFIHQCISGTCSHLFDVCFTKRKINAQFLNVKSKPFYSFSFWNLSLEVCLWKWLLAQNLRASSF